MMSGRKRGFASLSILAILASALPATATTTTTTKKPFAKLQGVTTIIGNGGQWMDVTLDHEVGVETPFGDTPDLAVKASGDFTGLVLVGKSKETAETVLLGAKIPSGKGGTTFLAPLPPYPLPGGGNYDFVKTYEDETILPAGEYRLYLLASGPARVRLRLNGAPGRTILRPRGLAPFVFEEPLPSLIGANGQARNVYSANAAHELDSPGLLFHSLWLRTKAHLGGQYFLCHRTGPPPVEPADSGPGCPFAEKAIANDRYMMLEPDTKLLFQGYAGVPAEEHGLGTWLATESVVEDMRYMTLWLPYVTN